MATSSNRLGSGHHSDATTWDEQKEYLGLEGTLESGLIDLCAKSQNVWHLPDLLNQTLALGCIQPRADLTALYNSGKEIAVMRGLVSSP